MSEFVKPGNRVEPAKAAARLSQLNCAVNDYVEQTPNTTRKKVLEQWLAEAMATEDSKTRKSINANALLFARKAMLEFFDEVDKLDDVCR